MASLFDLQEDAVPLKTLLIIMTTVIALAAATIAVVLAVAGDIADPSIAVLAGVSAVTLLASLLIRRFGPNPNR